MVAVGAPTKCGLPAQAAGIATASSASARSAASTNRRIRPPRLGNRACADGITPGGPRARGHPRLVAWARGNGAAQRLVCGIIDHPAWSTRPGGTQRLQTFPRAGVTGFHDARVPCVAVRARTSQPEDRRGDARPLARHPLVIPSAGRLISSSLLPRRLPIRGRPVTAGGFRSVENSGWAGARHPAPAGLVIKPLPKEPCPRMDRRFGSSAGTGRTGPEEAPATRRTGRAPRPAQ
jgi:hypothetical protein